MTAAGPLQEAIGYEAENEMFIQQLLQGKVDALSFANEYLDSVKEANLFITNMQKSSISNDMT